MVLVMWRRPVSSSDVYKRQVEAADDICYAIMDIEDSHKLKILSFAETEHLLLSFFDEDIQQKIRQRIIDEEMCIRDRTMPVSGELGKAR